jgi:hypothetical protein
MNYKELPIEVIDEEYKLKEYIKKSGLSYLIGKIDCECKKEKHIYLLIQALYIVKSVIVCKECYDNNNYSKLKLLNK